MAMVKHPLAAGILLLASCAFAQFSFRYDENQRVWTLANGQVEAVFQLTPEGHFTFQRLAYPPTGDAWTGPSAGWSCPIRLDIDGELYGPNTLFTLVSQSARPIARRGYRQTIVLEDVRRIGRVRILLEMFEGQPVLRSSIQFQNLRQSQVRVTAADALPLALADAGRSYRSFRVKQWVGGGLYGNFEPLADTLEAEKEIVVYSGAAGLHSSWLAWRDQNDRGLFAGWEFDGRSIATLEHFPNQGQLRLSVSVLDLNRPVGPQQEFRVPAAFLGAFRGNWDEAGFATQRFVEAAIARPMPDERFPYVAWDSWAYLTNIDEATLRRNAQIAASLGVELFIVDLGWARQIGDWHADPKKFPKGMRAVSDYVHSLGMKFGLHFALTEASPRAPVLMENPDWTASHNDNYYSSVSLCPGHRPVRDWLVREALRIIDEYGVDWILQDGENMVKRCTKSSHTHDPLDANYSNAVEGIDAIVAEVLARRPAVHWENCEDGGNMMTFSMARRYVTSIAADNSPPLVTRQAVYGVTYPFPPRYADRYMPEEPLNTYTTRSYMFGGPWIFMVRLANMSSQDLEFAAAEIRLFKSLRARIRDGKVFHLTGRPAENRIDALESYHPPTDSAVVFVYRPGAAPAYRQLRLRGLNPSRTYEVRLQNEPRRWTALGSALMEQGIRVELPRAYTAEIVYIEPAGGGG